MASEQQPRAASSSTMLLWAAAALALVGTLLLLPPNLLGAAAGTPPPGPAPVVETNGDDPSAEDPPQERSTDLVAPPPSAVPPPVQVSVETIGVDAPVVPLGLDEEGALEVPEDFSLVGWWSGGAAPGEPGPTVLVGHVDSYRGPAVFYRLRDLEVGDEVVVASEDEEPLTYRVTRVQEVPKDEFPTKDVYGETPGSTLRLITCGGPFDRSTRHYRHNTIVYAELT